MIFWLISYFYQSSHNVITNWLSQFRQFRVKKSVDPFCRNWKLQESSRTKGFLPLAPQSTTDFLARFGSVFDLSIVGTLEITVVVPYLIGIETGMLSACQPELLAVLLYLT